MKKAVREIETILESELMHKFLAGIIIFYVVVLCLEMSKIFSESWCVVFKTVDSVICAIFVVELIFRLFVSRLKFFRSGWNIFDFIVISLSVFASSGIAAFRVLRIFRVAEVINLSKHTRIIVNSIIRSIPILFHVFIALALAFLIFSISSIDLFGGTNPQLFGSLKQSSYTLLLVLIGDKMGDVLEQIEMTHPYGYIFFVAYQIIMSFIILNLFFGIIVNSLQDAIEREEKSKD